MTSTKLTTPEAVARIIDHTLLRPSATREDIVRIAEEGLRFGVAAVCVNPLWVPEVAHILKGTPVACCSVVGFPLGASHPELIAAEAERAVSDGATEIDMVMSIGHAKAGDWTEITQNVATIKTACGDNILKVILEICELTNQEIETASRICIEAGADFIKTSTGFGKHGATVEAVRIMANVSKGRAGIKAAGGIRTLADVRALASAGATRIGASATAAILAELP